MTTLTRSNSNLLEALSLLNRFESRIDRDPLRELKSSERATFNSIHCNVISGLMWSTVKSLIEDALLFNFRILERASI